MKKHPDLPLFLIVAASLAVLLLALARLAAPEGPFRVSSSPTSPLAQRTATVLDR